MPVAGRSFDPVVVESALGEILSSQYFRSSAQCSSLLRYMVENTLADRDECLRERVIGSEVFDRSPDYDTGNDHIVRSRASEVRKRLAQYYQSAGQGAGVRISIPSGSYRATFDAAQRTYADAVVSEPESPVELRHAVPEPSVPLVETPAVLPKQQALEEPKEPQEPGDALPLPKPLPASAGPQWIAAPGRLFIAVAVFLAFCAGAVFLARTWSTLPGSAFQRFWAPLNRSPKPALIYCGGGFVYKLSDPFLDAYRLKHGLKDTRREFFVQMEAGESVPGQDLIPDRHFVPFGDLASTARVVTTLSGFRKSYDLRYGDDLAFTEFRTSPVILIGGLNNSWALKVTHDLRYVLDQDDRIVDQWHREKVWTQTADPENQARDDYAIISRLNASETATGGFVLSIAGIRMYGTRAAAELVSDPARLNQILRDLPRGWETKNLQVVLHTRTMNEIPVSVNVEAMYSW